MSEPNELSELLTCLKELSKKLDVPKKKDLWDKIPIISSFLGTAVIGILTLVLTQSYQRLESNRQEKFQAAQIEAQKSQIRVEELKAITSLAPLLASKDQNTREVGKQLLRAVSESSLPNSIPESMRLPVKPVIGPAKTSVGDQLPSGLSSEMPQVSLIDKFAQIALASTESTARRLDATKQIGKIAAASTTPPDVKMHAVEAVTNIAMSNGAPEEVRKTASEIIARIKSIKPEQYAKIVADEPVTRKIDEVILHHTMQPNISNYKGPNSIFGMAEFLMAERKWSKLSWHYAISPDGLIWMGMPLNEPAIHTAGHNKTSVSVVMVIDGDKEQPTDTQKRTLGILMRDLFDKLTLSPEDNFAEHRGFHRDYANMKTCPGKNITKELILDCIKSARRSQ